MVASGSIYNDDGENDDNLGPNGEEKLNTLAEGLTRSQQNNSSLSLGDEFRMQAGQVVVSLSSEETEKILKNCDPEVRGDHWRALWDLVIKWRNAFALDGSELRSTDVE